jgi:hypothetical protein
MGSGFLCQSNQKSGSIQVAVVVGSYVSYEVGGIALAYSVDADLDINFLNHPYSAILNSFCG